MRHTSDTDISASTELLPLQEVDNVIKASNINVAKQTQTCAPGGDPEGSVEVENTSEDDVEAGGDATGGYTNMTRLNNACFQTRGSAASKTRGDIQTS